MRTRKNNKEQCKEYYRKNAEKRSQIVRARQKKILEEIQEYKLKIGCARCGYNKSARALSFHHTSKDKEHNVSKMCSSGFKIERIMEEVEKCECLCMNCHHEHHELEDRIKLV